MASGITLSAGVRNNLLSLQNTAELMGTTQNRLATGKKVNSALDNPSNFFTSSALQSRAGDLSSLLDSISSAVKTIEAADNGVAALTKLVETAQATARSALQTPVQVAGDPTVTAQATVSGTVTTLTDGIIAGLDGETLTVNGTDIDFTSGGINTLAEFETALRAATDIDNASTAGTGGVVITAENDADIVVSFSDASVGTALGFSATTTEPTTTVPQVANPKREELREQYNDLLGQIDQLVKDTSFNGVNLLAGDNLEVLFNEDGSSKLTIEGEDFDSAGLGLTTVSASGFNTNSGINTTLDDLKGAIDTLRTSASKFGSNLSVVQTRQNFTKSMINTLQTGADNLTLADTNEEAANMLALQTRQQLSSTALSLASQADQAVLRLF
jgi:flagellin